MANIKRKRNSQEDNFDREAPKGPPSNQGDSDGMYQHLSDEEVLFIISCNDELEYHDTDREGLDVDQVIPVTQLFEEMFVR